jgi:hypothetical protein
MPKSFPETTFPSAASFELSQKIVSGREFPGYVEFSMYMDNDSKAKKMLVKHKAHEIGERVRHRMAFVP